MSFRFLYFFSLLSFFVSCDTTQKQSELKLKEKLYPSEDYFYDKQFPEKSFHFQAYMNALREVNQLKQQSGKRTNGLWKVEGPGNIGARINTIAVHPTNPAIMLVGFSEGGIFKTKNNGLDWYPVFDQQVKLCIGDIIFDPTNPNIIYAGTGDPNISGYPFVGNGIFKSLDGGESWAYSGLAEVGIISQIRISPSNPNVLYVGAMGIPFIKNEHRGLYKSTNGGVTWQKALFVNDSTGVIDIALHPLNGDIIYVTTWNRVRNNKQSTVSGPDAHIFKSTNGGLGWNILSGGLPTGDFSRIGIDICKNNPKVLYTSYTHPITYNLEAIYKTENEGVTWQPLPIYDSQNEDLPKGLYGGFGWYFGKIRVNPDNENDIYILGVDLYRSLDGGQNWTIAAPPWWTYEVHADKHDLVFSGSNLLLATDGGLYKSSIFAPGQWIDIENIPTTQFYRVAYNPHEPNFYFGGAQDNGTTGGNADDINNWSRIYGGDGFQMVFHPHNPDIFYASSQNGNIVVTFDKGNSYQSGINGLDESDPRNWDMPYMMSHHDSNILYAGTNRIYRSEEGEIPEWVAISPVLTDSTSVAFRKNISSLHESPLNQDLFYAATSDGLVWRSSDFGLNWLRIGNSLPIRYITSVLASPDYQNHVFISFSGYRDNDNTPHIYFSDNRGESWISIQGDLPQIAINSMLIIPGYESKVIFVATDGGVFYTNDRGKKWQYVGQNMPSVAVYHLAYNPTLKTVIAGTYGRSIMSFDTRQIDLISSTNNITKPLDFSLWPTVSTDWIQIKCDHSDCTDGSEGYIMNNEGKILSSFTLTHPESTIDISPLIPGKYYLSILTKKGMATKTFIKVRS